MSAVLHLTHGTLERTSAHFRECGQGRRECQVLWVGPWSEPEKITEVVHPKHAAHMGGFILDDRWLNDFWFRLSMDSMGIRAQVHTHPGAAFHSQTDDAYPIIHTIGFLSLVIPKFGMGPIGFDGAYLAEIQSDGHWQEVLISNRMLIK